MGNVINGVEEMMVAGLSLDKKIALSCSRNSLKLRDALRRQFVAVFTIVATHVSLLRARWINCRI